MRGYEALAVAYFACLAAAAPWTPVPRRRRLEVLLAALAMAAAIVAVVAMAPREGAPHFHDALRAWAPLVYLVAGYWLPALLAGNPVHPTRFEQWLQRTDAVLRPAAPRVPRALAHVVELAYLVCYPLVPAAFAVVWIAGSPADVERFWLAVLAAGYACYASLPWLVSRPPRLAGSQRRSRGQTPADLNVFVLGRVSHQLNTFPSGHVAVALASAACVAPVSTVAGILVGLTGVAIAFGAAAGRYHYVIDVGLGIVVAALAVTAAFT